METNIVLFGGSDPAFLECARVQIGAMVEGRLDQATARLRLKLFLRAQGYTPPALDGREIDDFESDARLNLILEANVEVAHSNREWNEDQHDDLLYQWPALELGCLNRHADAPGRWAQARGIICGGRMVALKSDPVWERLSPFGLPYGPFDFECILTASNVDRNDWTRLNPANARVKIRPRIRNLDDDLECALKRCEGILQAWPSSP